METVLTVVALLLVMGVTLLVLIYRKQCMIDIPQGGLLVVDKREDKPLVYFQATQDPGTFTDGEWLRLQVTIVEK